MIEKEEIVEIGKFQKTHALKGELNALLDVDKDFEDYDFPFIIEMDGIFVPFYIESIRPKGSESYLVKLKGIDSQEEAQELVNKTIYGVRKEIEEYFGGEYLEIASGFIGFSIIDTRLGKIGEVTGIEDSTANVLFIVKTDNGNEVYIPAVDDLITCINEEKKVIETDLPEGLIDINI